MSFFLDSANQTETVRSLSGVFHDKVVENILQVFKEMGKERPLLVLDDQVFTNETTQEIINALAELEYATFSGYPVPISLDDVKLGTAQYFQNDCDSLIAIGGGSTVDLAKLIGLLACNNHPWSEFFYNPNAGRRIPLLIAVPTSFGGSESSTGAFALDFSGPLVRNISREYFVPAYVAYDWRYLTTLPKKVVVANLLSMLLSLVELYLRGNDVEEMFIRLGVLAKEVLDKNHDYYPDLQNFSLDMGKLYRNSGYGFLSGLSCSIAAFTEVPCNLVKAIFMSSYLRYELGHSELAEIASLLSWPSSQALLQDIDKSVEGSGIREELEQVKGIIAKKEMVIALQSVQSEQGEEDFKGISSSTVRQLMKEVLEY
ncbi:iron-containing alcohol dehydrogenase [Clostridia bacterium]|nr:iron-containing alcohol dehydrogenase [Clostridia bacterium]